MAFAVDWQPNSVMPGLPRRDGPPNVAKALE